MKEYALSAAAGRDLEEISEYIAADSVSAARKLMAKFYATMERIGQHPGIGHSREDLVEGRKLLFFPVGNYLIVYRTDSRPVLILAVVHGNRHIPTFLRSRRL